jgi:hypothetical protein
MQNPDTVLVPRADLVHLEMSFLDLWQFVHHLHADLEEGAEVCRLLSAMRQTLDKALQNYIIWRVAKQAWDTRR